MSPPGPGNQSSDFTLTLDGVGMSFIEGGKKTKALDEVSFRVRSGLVTGLIGPDGAGKTTLMRLATGLLLPDEGSINVLGIDAVREPLMVQESVGYMPQRFGLYEDLTVQENLDLYADLRGVPKAERPGRYAELMRMTGLSPFTKRLAGALSGGMKQKLGLACTLVGRPRLLLLDEPTVGVDPVSRRELWAIVYRLVEKEGTTVLLSTAYLDEAERCSDVIVIHEGRVLGQGPPASFSTRVKGRSFRVTVHGMNKRSLQERLAGAPGVADSVIQGEAVRVVMDEGAAPEPEKLLSGLGEVRLVPVEPRFEDSFIVMIKKGSAPSPPASPEGPGTTSGGEEVIVVNDVKRRFGDFYAVKGVSFTVRRGEVFGLLGANGAGKSTTFRMLCGLLPSSGGTLRVAGYDLRRAAAKTRGRIGYMAQRFSLYADLSVMENLRFFASAYGLRGERLSNRLDWALTEFDLTPFANGKSADLPLGYKQRLALAAALMHEPDILFLDEPTSGVDPIARREFWHRINVLAGRGVTVLVTTHFMEEAEYCDRLVIMAEGEVLAQGTPAEMKDRFRSPERPEPTMEEAFIGLIEAC
jgi:ABC-2 type transport system ATP-binding protein